MRSLSQACCPTPLLALSRLASRMGFRELLVKIESSLPISHTFKDRGAFAAVEEAVRLRSPAVLAATCGNMGVAVAGASALFGMPSLIILSSEAPTLTQKMIHATATNVWLTDGRFDDLDKLVRSITDAVPQVACINTTLNASFRRGFRSLMAELLLQLDPKCHYAVCVPTADGTLLAACHDEYVSYRKLRSGPTVRFVMCQPAGCAPLVRAHLHNETIARWGGCDTEVLSLSVREPFLHGPDALKALIDTNGTAVAVPEKDVTGFAKLFATHAGIFSDAVGGVLLGAIAALERGKWFLKDEVPVGIYTGNGLTAANPLAEVPVGPVRSVASYRDVQDEIVSFIRAA